MLATELDVLKFWEEKQIFEKSLNNRKGNEVYVYYDGPPFATGTPHWGHILISQIKDSVLRYWTQKGKYLPRRWGWDCHGVPVEKIVEKELEIKDRRQIEEEIGIEKFNELCRSKIMIYDEEWRKTIDRIGRWVDMDDQYRTMDNDYIESVWWGLGQLWQKNLIYKGYRNSLYSPSIGIPLSHTDVAMEVKYQNETLQSPIVRFKVAEDSVRKLSRKILEQIASSYSDQLRYKSEIEKRLNILEQGGQGKRTNMDTIMKDENYQGVEWEDLQTGLEVNEETLELRQQYDTVLENIDTLSRMKDILGNRYSMSLLAWTTTPWTLPANVALAVDAEAEYSMYFLGATNEIVVLAEKKAIPILSMQLHETVINSPDLEEALKNVEDSSDYFNKLGVDIIKIVGFEGKDLAGLEYQAVFEPVDHIESYEERANLHKVYTTDFATAEEGTGIVHLAPAHGPEEFELRKVYNLPILTVLNEHGEIRSDLHPELKPVYGMHYEKANDKILDLIENKNLLFAKLKYTHKVPYYDRDGKKVIYSAQEGWFIAESKLQAKSLELNEQISWHPENLKHGRFGKGLETAPDWSISRSRYWGNPIPIWQTEDKSKTIFVDSVAKLEKMTVNPIYKILNDRNLRPELYDEGNTVILADAHTKLPLGISATQYRSKALTELRKQRMVDINKFATYAQKVLEEVLELFKKYKMVQILFNDEEQRMWTTWLYSLHPKSKKITEIFYFYKNVEPDVEGFKPVGGVKLLDLHRPAIDEIILEDDLGNAYYRIKDVLDCWVESGSMAWASNHYPMMNQKIVEENTPADWICEAQDQTRGWFRTLHVLNTGVLNKPAARNINTTGMILAADGKKMSKSKQNFTDPNQLLEKFGADSVRAYLLSSNLLNAESLRFKDSDLQTIFRETTLLLSNSNKYISFVTNTYGTNGTGKVFKHPLNQWWLAYTQDYVRKIDSHMQAYKIHEAARLIVPYIDNFSTWYIRRSKDLLDTHGEEVAATLIKTMKLFSKATASLQPFNCEKIWSLLKTPEDVESVHLTDYPVLADQTQKDVEILEKMDHIRDLVSDIHSARKQNNVRVRQPLYCDFSKLKLKEDWLEMIYKECNLLEKNLGNLEGEMFEKETDFGTLRVDLVVDISLSVLGFARDFERSVQAYRKSQGFKPGQTVKMQWKVEPVGDQELVQEVIKNVDWDKLCIDVSWVENLESDKSFEVRDVCKITVG